MRFRAEVLITLKSGVLDTQGKAVSTSLRHLGHQGLEEVRIGRVASVVLEASSTEDARRQVEAMCRDLLVNDIIEEARIGLEAL